MGKKKEEPKYSYETAKQLLFDCAMELHYHQENISDEALSAKILSIIDELDKIQCTSNVLRIDFKEVVCNSDNEPIEGTERELSILFNKKVISQEEVKKLITEEVFWSDERVIVMSKKQADNLRRR